MIIQRLETPPVIPDALDFKMDIDIDPDNPARELALMGLDGPNSMPVVATIETVLNPPPIQPFETVKPTEDANLDLDVPISMHCLT